MEVLRPEIREYGTEVTNLLESWGIDDYFEHFDSHTIAGMVIHCIRDSYCYQYSKYRCAIRISAIVLDAHKQLAEIKSRLADFPKSLVTPSKRTH